MLPKGSGPRIPTAATRSAARSTSSRCARRRIRTMPVLALGRLVRAERRPVQRDGNAPGISGTPLPSTTQNESGYVNQSVPLFSTTDPSCSPCATPLGSTVASHLALGTLTYSFSQDADITGRVFVLGDNRDQSSAINGIDKNAADIGTPTYDQFVGPGRQTFAQVIRAYQLRERTPLGAGELTPTSRERQQRQRRGRPVSPYDLVHIDQRYNAGLTWQRTFATSQFAFGGYTRYESIKLPRPPPTASTPPTPFQAQPSSGSRSTSLFARGRIPADGQAATRRGAFSVELHDLRGESRRPVRCDLQRRPGHGAALLARHRLPRAAADRTLPVSIQPTRRSTATMCSWVRAAPASIPSTRPNTSSASRTSSQSARRSTFRSTSTNLRNPVEIFYPLGAVASGSCTRTTRTQHPIAGVRFVPEQRRQCGLSRCRDPLPAPADRRSISS